jgi:hypothetical protein
MHIRILLLIKVTGPPRLCFEPITLMNLDFNADPNLVFHANGIRIQLIKIIRILLLIKVRGTATTGLYIGLQAPLSLQAFIVSVHGSVLSL